MSQCPKCGADINQLKSTSTCEICGYTLSSSSDGYNRNAACTTAVPWENVHSLGLPKAFFETLKATLFRPRCFFSHIDEKTSTFNAWLFALLTGSLGVIFNILWQINGYSFFDPSWFSGSSMNLSITNTNQLLFSPLFLSINLIISAGYCQFLLWLTRKAKKRYASTFSVVCYTQSVSLLSIIPFIGNVIAPFWAFYLLVTGISRVHELSPVRTVIILFLPLLLLVILLFFIAVAAIGGGLLMQNFFKEFFSFLR